MIARARRMVWRGVFAFAIACALVTGLTNTLAAQVRPPVPPVRPDTITKPVLQPRSLPPDTIRKPQPRSLPPDTIPKVQPRSLPPDTIRKGGLLDTIPKLGRDKLLFEWDPPDSTMTELQARKGYRQVQYQGDHIRFNSKSRLLELLGVPAAVKRDETMLVGDTIIYNDSTKFVSARGDSVTLRDPTQSDADDFVAKGRIDYDLGSRSAGVGAFATSVESGGDRLFIEAKSGMLFSDTLVSGKHTVFASDGTFTYCDLTEPHFHFTTKSMKFVSQNIMVARPGVLYIGEIPVFWIPFFFQDVRKGRRSGLLTPNFGIAELLRNSPSYRRQINNMGYHFALNDYMSAAISFDWRSGANGIPGDEGFVRSNFDYDYRWISRFINGHFSAEQMALNSGNKNLSISWSHAQDFSKQTKLTANLNWVQSTTIQRQTTLNPVAATASIMSQLNYQTRVGPASLQFGGTRRQYPGRRQTETDFPSVTVTTGPLSVGPITWTPGGRAAISSATRLDQGVQFPFLYTPRPGGGNDSTRIDASRRNFTANFDSPIRIFDFNWQNSFSLREDLNRFPEERTIINVNNPADSSRRVFAKTFQTNFEWNTSFNLPTFFRGSWNISPNISFNNVDPQGGLLVRTERSGGRWVSQSKRASYGISTSPTLYAKLPGIGPIVQFRHAISPSLNYSYSPAADVSDEFLGALGRVRRGYLGALAQNRVSLGFNTTLEGKLRQSSDSLDAPARKLNLLVLNASSLSWDFIRADTAGTGLVEPNFSLGLRSDLLPGMDFRINYSLFQGDPLSDTASLKPFRTDIGTSFSLNSKSAIFGVIGRLLGIKSATVEGPAEGGPGNPTISEDVARNQREQSNAAGSRGRGSGVNIPQGQGWSLNLQYNGARQRPPRGGTIIVNDPATLCEAKRFLGEAAYQLCIDEAQSAPPPGSNPNPIIGGPSYISPPTQNVASNLTFNITPNWAAQWSTSYDMERSRFASQQVGLQRQLHDWTTTFSFTQSPNGAFSFAFFIALKAQPALKFDYNRATYRSTGGN